MATKRTQAERTELSDKKMLEAATQLILEHGTQKTTLKEIGERAGYSRGLASARFGTRDGLFSVIIARHRQLWVEYIREYTKGLSGLDAILARIDAVDAMFRKEPENIKVMYLLWYESVSKESPLRSQLEACNREGRDAIVLLVKRSMENGEIAYIEAESFASAYMSNLFGLVYQWLVSPQQTDLRKSIEALKSYCRYMLQPEG
ncbi:MAG: TetR/AcrR family transcriptional regulator [Porticoccaceae bacterium]|nr:TetR/AcrR family transcriptional regulator [Pseudomonadales bacterium]MCP5171063.1 TetR/AcrR family transcriptional regulator [Pseudomonadales bacterium]MCP5301698.1 TetR/AcrR family transcriptional regulator [Pseudomonadales bacterium]